MKLEFRIPTTYNAIYRADVDTNQAEYLVRRGLASYVLVTDKPWTEIVRALNDYDDIASEDNTDGA